MLRSLRTFCRTYLRRVSAGVYQSAVLWKGWWAKQGSNLRPPVCKTGALTAELFAHANQAGPAALLQPRAVESHVARIMSNLGPFNRAQAIKTVIGMGLLA
jgi:hypothetical protein